MRGRSTRATQLRAPVEAAYAEYLQADENYKAVSPLTDVLLPADNNPFSRKTRLLKRFLRSAGTSTFPWLWLFDFMILVCRPAPDSSNCSSVIPCQIVCARMRSAISSPYLATKPLPFRSAPSLLSPPDVVENDNGTNDTPHNKNAYQQEDHSVGRLRSGIRLRGYRPSGTRCVTGGATDEGERSASGLWKR